MAWVKFPNTSEGQLRTEGEKNLLDCYKIMASWRADLEVQSHFFFLRIVNSL